MHRRAAAAFGVFVRRQIGDIFPIWIRILCFAHFNWVSFWFCNQAAQRVRTAVRRWRMITVRLSRRLAACGRGRRHPWHLWLASDHAHQLAVCLSSLRSYFLSLLVVFLVLGCVSRAE